MAQSVSHQCRTSPRLASPVSRLPPELLAIAFKFLPCADLKNALMVCRLGSTSAKVCREEIALKLFLSEGCGGRLVSGPLCGLHSNSSSWRSMERSMGTSMVLLGGPKTYSVFSAWKGFRLLSNWLWTSPWWLRTLSGGTVSASSRSSSETPQQSENSLWRVCIWQILSHPPRF